LAIVINKKFMQPTYMS